MTRREQNDWFLKSFHALLGFAILQGIPVRGGEWQRPDILARIYSTGIDLWNRGLRLFSNKVGIEVSKHKYSLAVDLWITSEDGKDILWEDPRYALLAKAWESLGGVAGLRVKTVDRYHVEAPGAVC
jgi:hypothetical protein